MSPIFFLKKNHRLYHFLALIIISSGFSGSAIALNEVSFYAPKNMMLYQPEAGWENKKVNYEPPLKADLFISLDQQQYPFFNPLIQQYAKQHNLVIKVNDGTCGVSAGLLRKKAVDIGGYCCPPGKFDRLAGLQFHTVGIMSLAIIANKSVPLDNLSLEQATKIFKGEINDFSTLTRTSSRSITTIIRPHCKKRPGHWHLLVDKYRSFSNAAINVGAIADMLIYTANKKNALGYETPWVLKQYAKNLPLKVLSINGVSPNNLKALANNTYPLYRTYNLTSWQDSAHKNDADKLIQWLIIQVDKKPEVGMVSAATLKNNGWHFKQDELIAEPNKALASK